VVGLGVADGRLDRLATLEQSLFMGTERLVLAPAPMATQIPPGMATPNSPT